MSQCPPACPGQREYSPTSTMPVCPSAVALQHEYVLCNSRGCGPGIRLAFFWGSPSLGGANSWSVPYVALSKVVGASTGPSLEGPQTSGSKQIPLWRRLQALEVVDAALFERSEEFKARYHLPQTPQPRPPRLLTQTFRPSNQCNC